MQSASSQLSVHHIKTANFLTQAPEKNPISLAASREEEAASPSYLTVHLALRGLRRELCVARRCSFKLHSDVAHEYRSKDLQCIPNCVIRHTGKVAGERGTASKD